MKLLLTVLALASLLTALPVSAKDVKVSISKLRFKQSALKRA